MDRRQFVTTAATTGTCALLQLPNTVFAQTAVAKAIRLTANGGESGESVRVAYIDPFKAKTGIEVVFEETTGTPLGKLRAMVESGRVDTVLHELGAPALAQAKALGLVEPLDWAAIAPAPLFAEAQDPFGLGYQYFSVVPTWRADAKPLTSWADLWNVKDYPGRRTLPDIPYHAIPIALMADGVAIDKLYPIDLDRAFRSLNRIKEHVQVWWTAGSQAPQLLADNEVRYAAAYSGRVVGNAKFGSTYNQGLLWLSYFAIAKGAAASHKLAAYKLLHEMSIPQNQAIASRVVPYTGGSPDLDRLLPQERIGQYPTTRENKVKQVPPNAQFWYDNAQVVEKRWQQFKLGL